MPFSNPVNLLIAGIYYALVGIIAFFSIFAVYVLLRYGRSRAFTFTVSVVYSLIFLAALQQSYTMLQTVLNS